MERVFSGVVRDVECPAPGTAHESSPRAEPAASLGEEYDRWLRPEDLAKEYIIEIRVLEPFLASLRPEVWV
ncbi:unnamed protein product [Lota lota]